MYDDPSQSKRPPLDPRVLFAADRTLLAWIRTGVAMMGFGFVIARFGLFLRELAASNQAVLVHRPGYSSFVGTAMIGLGAIVTALAALQHVHFLRRYRLGEEIEPTAISLGTVLAGIVCIAGVALAVYLLAV